MPVSAEVVLPDSADSRLVVNCTKQKRQSTLKA
jgi:hypothetical protein